MNENLKDINDGTNTIFLAQGHDGNGNFTEPFEKEGRVYYPFVITGYRNNRVIEHLPSGMSMSLYKIKTLKHAKKIITELRKVSNCDVVEILGTQVVKDFAGVFRDNQE